MRLKQLSLLTGALLSLLFWVVAADIAQASHTVDLAQNSSSNEPPMKGIVRSVVGNQVLVKLERSQNPYVWLGMSRSELGALNIMGGTPVFVRGRRIVGLAPNVGSPAPSSNFSSRVQALWADFERGLEEPRTPTSMSLPPSDSSLRTSPLPSVSEPVQGLW